jgi:hypothetical protein
MEDASASHDLYDVGAGRLSACVHADLGSTAATARPPSSTRTAAWPPRGGNRCAT